jgi:hypothetical protein
LIFDQLINDEKLVWSGKYLPSKNSITIDGALALEIKINFDTSSYEFVNGEDNEVTYKLKSNSFLRATDLTQFVDYYKSYLTQNPTISIPTTSYTYPPNISKFFKINIKDDYVVDEKFQCLICTNYKCEKSKMRHHIGKHILNKDIEIDVHLCGFCGKIGCSIGLDTTSGRGSYKTLGPSSDCKYFYQFSLGAAMKSSKYSPCTNRPVECSICLSKKKNFICWSYNLVVHYKDQHPSTEPPSIDNDEITRVKNFKK